MDRISEFKKMMALLLALMLLVTACGRKKTPTYSFATRPAGTNTAAPPAAGQGSAKAPAGSGAGTAAAPTNAAGADWRTEARGLSDEPVELPPWPYNSPALDFSPAEGIRITAEAGSLYDDTEITLTPVTGDSEQRVLEIAEGFEDYGEPLIGAWEVHAGLEEDEHLPGEYTVSIDLSTLDLDESLWPAVRLYRLTDGGKMTAFNTELEGSILRYSTDQNSITLASVATCAVVALALGLPLTYGIVKYNQDSYYWDWTGASYHHGTTEYGNYTIKWSMKDVDPKQQEKNDRMLEIAKKYKPKAEKDYELETKIRADMSVLYRMFNKNKSVAERLTDYLVKDEEYRKIAASLKTPELIVAVAEAIDHAYAYLGGVVRARMPKDELTFRLKRTDGKGKEDTYGNSVASILADSYIEINVDKITGILKGDAKGNEDKDNMLLTVTHELFHICQERYHFRYFTDSTRYDEMTALVLEADAKKYYQEEKIIKTDPKLTQTNYWGTLRLPIDDSLLFNHLVMEHQGYLLSELARYIREQTGVQADGVDIYRCRSYYTTPGTSKPLMAAFHISEVTFDKLFRQFCVDHKNDIALNYEDAKSSEEYNLYPETELQKDKGSHVSLSTDGSYSAGVRCFNMYDGQQLPLLMVTDKDLAAQHPEVNLVPGESYTSTRGGAYLPGAKKIIGPRLRKRRFVEIYGKLGPNTDTTAGYTVWPMDAPDEPKLASADNALTVTLPEPRGAAKEGLLDGMLVNISSSDGKKTEKEYSKALYGKTVTIPLNELLEDSTEQAELTVSIAEFVYSTKDKACPGRWSKEVKIPVTYALKGTSYQFNSTTMVSFASEMAHPALREAFEHSTLYLSDDGSITIKGSGRASREPEDDDDTVEGSAVADFTITGKWDMKKDEGTATIRGTITHKETYNGLKEITEVNHATDRDGIRLTLTSSDRTYRKEVTDFSYTFSGTGTVKAVNKELYKGIDGLILSLGTNWTRSGKYEHWRWTSYDRTGVPDNEIHTSTEPVLVKSEDHKDPWEEGWKICWTVGKHDPVLHVGTTTTMTLIPGK